jgi:hypothetical protein
LAAELTNLSRAESNRIRYLRQSVTLTGFGTPTFENGIKGLLQVHELFDRHVPENKLDECSIVDKCDDFLGVHLSNRYFSSWHENPTGAHIPFAPMVDPSGFLTSLVKTQYFHGEQNVVKYYNRSVDSRGVIK